VSRQTGWTDLCPGATARPAARERIFAWLAEGTREVRWALCSLPRERWALEPPPHLGGWPALRHARHLALRQRHLTLPAVRSVLGNASVTTAPRLVFEQADAAWDAHAADQDAEALVDELGETRFDLLQLLESAPDAVWQPPARLDTLLLHARQHELEHLAHIWRVALYWDRSHDTFESATDLPLHAADRFSQGVTLR
jgi:hypothetical protein